MVDVYVFSHKVLKQLLLTIRMLIAYRQHKSK